MREASKLQRQVAGQILRHIRNQGLESGTPLTELGLAETFKVSRTPVRAALDLLASTGVVASQPRGFRVADPLAGGAELLGDEDGLAEEEALYLRIASDYLGERLADQFTEADLIRRYAVGRGLLNRVLRRMSRDLVIEQHQGRGWSFATLFKSVDADADSYRFRLLIEPMAILEPGYAIDRPRAAACRRAHEAILATPRERLSTFRFVAVNAEFHELIAAGSRNGFILQAVQQQNRLRRLLSLQWPYGEQRMIESCEEHMAVLTAVEQGELEWAAALMRRHLELAARTPPA